MSRLRAHHATRNHPRDPSIFRSWLNYQKHVPSRMFNSTARSTPTNRPPPLSFVFDIDGVLLRGPDVLPAAKRALNILEGNNSYGKAIPYILLTNGGGIGEHERAQRLSTQLGFPIHPSQYCQAHTILKKFSHNYRDKPVLVLGGKQDAVRKVANGYGYRKACTTLDVLAWNPSVWPFHTLSEEEEASTHKIDFSKTPISAIFVYHDPRNWALDVQVACDVIQSAGIIGGPYIPLEKQQQPVELIFCNSDLIWRSDFNRPRLGQGSFKVAFQAVFKALTGAEYPHTQFGKPTKATYEYATEMLKGRINEIYGESDVFPRVYMIGDNPESDIAGANGANWYSILVKTGVYDPSLGRPSHSPTHYADNVEEAVKWALEQQLGRELREGGLHSA